VFEISLNSGVDDWEDFWKTKKQKKQKKNKKNKKTKKKQNKVFFSKIDK
jgi:hypothetical protein